MPTVITAGFAARMWCIGPGQGCRPSRRVADDHALASSVARAARMASRSVAADASESQTGLPQDVVTLGESALSVSAATPEGDQRQAPGLRRSSFGAAVQVALWASAVAAKLAQPRGRVRWRVFCS
jgi:hypothetical protein